MYYRETSWNYLISLFHCNHFSDYFDNECCHSSGPDPNRIYDIDGYDSYLSQNFPKLDYVNRCYVVDEVDVEYFSEGEF